MREGDRGKYLWVVNPIRESREITIQLAARDVGLRVGKDLWQGKPATLNGNAVKVTVGSRNAVVIRAQGI